MSWFWFYRSCSLLSPPTHPSNQKYRSMSLSSLFFTKCISWSLFVWRNELEFHYFYFHLHAFWNAGFYFSKLRIPPLILGLEELLRALFLCVELLLHQLVFLIYARHLWYQYVFLSHVRLFSSFCSWFFLFVFVVFFCFVVQVVLLIRSHTHAHLFLFLFPACWLLTSMWIGYKYPGFSRSLAFGESWR